MTKQQLIERYGEEWYENYKMKNRIKLKAKYDEDPEAERRRRRERYRHNPGYTKEYNKRHADVYLINSRDRNRFMLMGVDMTGKELHHIKYHLDKDDPTWINDVQL